MALDWTEFWKIKGNILNQTHKEAITEKPEPDKKQRLRRLSRRSVVITDLQQDPAYLQLQQNFYERQRRNSYIPPAGAIQEETEQSKSSSNENSSFDIYNNNESSSSENAEERIQKPNGDKNASGHLAPQIHINQFSSTKIKKIKKTIESEDSSVSDSARKKKKSSSSSDSSSSSSSSPGSSGTSELDRDSRSGSLSDKFRYIFPSIILATIILYKHTYSNYAVMEIMQLI